MISDEGVETPGRNGLGTHTSRGEERRDVVGGWGESRRRHTPNYGLCGVGGEGHLSGQWLSQELNTGQGMQGLFPG